jgi:DNA polymerase III delta prime subunit
MKPQLLITQTSVSEPLLIEHLKNSYEGKWIISDYSSKSDFKDDLANLDIDYPMLTNIYLGNLESFSVNFQQSILKFLEEPPVNLRIFISKPNEFRLLTTIKSRVDINYLDTKTVLSLLDQEYIEKLKKLFLPPSDAVKKLVASNLDLEDFGDIAKAEREDLINYLWLIKFNLESLYSTNFNTTIAKRIEDVLISIQSLNESCQKKIALAYLLF